MVDEQDTAEELSAQTDFDESHPEKESLDHRSRDAESTLSERMGYNHSKGIDKQSAGSLESKPIDSDKVETDSTEGSKWQDGLRREEDDKA